MILRYWKNWALATTALGFSLLIHPIAKPLTQAKKTPLNKSVSLVLIGDMNGNLSPCGCTSPMTGGIKRLATLVRQEREIHQNSYLLINGGTILNESQVSSVGAKQSLLKAKLVAETSKALAPGILHFGDQEASYGQDLLAQMAILAPHLMIQGAVQGSSKITEPFHFPNWRKLGPFLIGGAEESSNEVAFAISGHQQSLKKDISQLVYEAEVKGLNPILLLRGNLTQASEIAEDFPQLKLIAYSSKGTAPQHPKIVGKTWLVSSGDDGKQAAIIDWSDGKFTRSHVQSLTPNYADDKKVKTLYANYLSEVGAENLLAQLPRISNEHFAGSFACLSCHARSYHIWLNSAHAHAFHDLVLRGHQQDPDCVKCHVTGLESAFGFRTLLHTPQFAMVTCESCHGPGVLHCRSPKINSMANGLQSCVKCHTPDNSPNFSFAPYWSRIEH